MTNVPPELDLSDDEQREVLYAILLRHFPETQPLRDRAVDCLVLGALFGTTEDSALKLTEIQRNLRVGEAEAALRIETIRPAVDRLIAEGKVVVTSRRLKKVFYLAAATQIELGGDFLDSKRMFTNVIGRIVDGLSHTESASHVCRRFLSNCFARFGRQIAKMVTGDITAEELMARIDAQASFEAACDGFSCTPNEGRLLYGRCVQFLKSSHHEDQRLKLYLTRAFYFASLLELDDRASRDLSRAEFSNSIVYLDTNIIIPTLLGKQDWISAFREVLQISARLSIEVRVSGATISEARNVAALRIQDLERIIAKLPEEVIEPTRDTFLTAYLERRDEDPTVTVPDLMHPFDNLRVTLQGAYGIVIDEASASDFELVSGEAERLIDVIARTAEELRGRPKSRAAVEHDVVEYLIAKKECDAGNRAFVLTHDRTLIEAGRRYAGVVDRPIHLSFLGFLQSIAPYVTAAEEITFVDAFSRLLIDQLPPINDAFDIRELRLLADVYDDVQQTPPEQLVEAYHYVKRDLSHRAASRALEPNQVVLGLRKFLANSGDEKRRALAAQIDALHNSLAAKDVGAAALQENASRYKADAAAANAESEELRAQLSDAQAALRIRSEGEQQHVRDEARRETRHRRTVFVVSSVAASVIWMIRPAVVAGLVSVGTLSPTHRLAAGVGVDLLGAVLFLMGAVRLFSVPFVQAGRAGGSRLAAVAVAVYFVSRSFDVGGIYAKAEPKVSGIMLLVSVVLWLLSGDKAA